MGLIWKETAKRAPVVTAILCFIYLLLSEMLQLNFPLWVHLLIIVLIFSFSSLVIYLYFESKGKKGMKITDQDVKKVDTGGGDFIIGRKGKNTGSVEIEKNKVKDIRTGGGDFTIGTEDK